MGGNSYFQFKQFRIEQAQSAMKVGVDGVLLGAWTDLTGAKRILDVGTGTGLIALMLAQRSLAKITAIEIEKKAAKEATENVAISKWANRIQVQHISFSQFLRANTQKFDLIVSNPPYFSNATKASTGERTMARHNDQLPLKELISGAVQMLNPKGEMAFVLPYTEMKILQDLVTVNRLYVKQLTEIKPKPSKSPNRMLVQLTQEPTQQQNNNLSIYNDNSMFTEEYKDLTRDFYLKF